MTLVIEQIGAGLYEAMRLWYLERKEERHDMV